VAAGVSDAMEHVRLGAGCGTNAGPCYRGASSFRLKGNLKAVHVDSVSKRKNHALKGNLKAVHGDSVSSAEITRFQHWFGVFQVHQV
jgi:hypothetical protein